MSERDDDAAGAAHEAGQILLRLRQPTCGDGGALRFERVGLSRRQLAELGRAAEAGLDAQLLADRFAHVVRLPDEVEVRERRDEVGPGLARVRRPRSARA